MITTRCSPIKKKSKGLECLLLSRHCSHTHKTPPWTYCIFFNNAFWFSKFYLERFNRRLIASEFLINDEVERGAEIKKKHQTWVVHQKFHEKYT
jgi:hypothetical protein